MREPSTRPLKVGIVLPDTELEMARQTAHWRDLVAMAQHAEAVGIDSVWVTDHLFFRTEANGTQGLWECWSLLAALAASTNRIEVGPLVSCTAFRNPVFLSQTVATVSDISDGRLILGLGAGWNDAEFAAAGLPLDHRVSRFEEALTIIMTLLKTGEMNFSGTFGSATNAELRLRGPSGEGPVPPLLIGGYLPRMMRIVAQHADIWNAWGVQSLELLADYRVKLDTACDAVGRDPATLARSVSILVDTPDAPGRMREQQTPWRVSPAECADRLNAYAEAGVSHVQLVLNPNTRAGIDYVAETLEHLDRASERAS